MNKIVELGKIYAEYEIFSRSTFHMHTPLSVFQDLFPNNHYSKDINTFLEYQDYKATKRGADLPWWGKKYFTLNNDRKYMIISQDSLSADSGSVVFYTHIMQEISNRKAYEHYRSRLSWSYRNFHFGNWTSVKETITNWGVDFDNLFITDASKVYMEESKSKFDKVKSKDLLIEEIKFCKPHILILLGGSPLNILAKEYIYADIVDNARLLEIEGVRTVVCPFPSGQGRSHKHFKARMENATHLLRNLCLNK